MSASEMMNEELAKELLETVGLDSQFCICDRCVAVREAASRLREPEKYCNCDKCVTYNGDIRRRLKVAEDALDIIYKAVDNRRNVDVSTLVKSIIADALAAIREEGGAK